MKKKSDIFIALLFLLINITLFGQSGVTIRGGGAVTVNGNLTITPAAFVCGIPMTDTRDSKTYGTVLIGTQCWMAQNLNIGTQILGISDQTDNSVIEKYCYNDVENNCNTYGGLYQWNEAMQYSTTEGARGICPTGWHLPTDAEWTNLTTFLGGVAVAGGKMKETGYAHWLSPNTGATNSSGFTALPGGGRYSNGNFNGMGTNTAFWASLQLDASNARIYSATATDEDMGQTHSFWQNGVTVRCIRD
jgi:uncharacterized protein (TIGR02145 family)